MSVFASRPIKPVIIDGRAKIWLTHKRRSIKWRHTQVHYWKIKSSAHGIAVWWMQLLQQQQSKTELWNIGGFPQLQSLLAWHFNRIFYTKTFHSQQITISKTAREETENLINFNYYQSDGMEWNWLKTRDRERKRLPLVEVYWKEGGSMIDQEWRWTVTCFSSFASHLLFSSHRVAVWHNNNHNAARRRHSVSKPLLAPVMPQFE